MQIPEHYQEFLALSPEQIQQLCDELAERPLDPNSIERWLEDWGKLAALFQECMARFDIATAVNTADEDARQRVAHYREAIWPIAHRMDQRLSERQQIHADLIPPVLREVEARWSQASRLNQSQAAIDLLNREAELVNQYGEIMGRLMIQWEGETLPEVKVQAVLQESDRARRESAWRTIHDHYWQDRDAISRVWSELIDIRCKLAEENGFDDYLAYRWAELGRSDYTPDDSRALHTSLLTHWAPLHSTLMNARKESLQVESLRPWDDGVSLESEQLRPYDTTADLLQKTLNVFRRMDPEFSAYVEKLRDMGFIDLAERTHTTPIRGFSRAIGRHGNFIFMNIQRTPADVVGLIHEIGHAVAVYASCKQPYLPFWGFPADFSETPSSAMEMLTQPYWDEFYNTEELKLVRRQHFQGVLRSSLFEAAYDAFQHWAYRNPELARNSDSCDAQWHGLMQRYMPGLDWTGIEKLNGMGWQRWNLSFYLPLHAMEYVYGRIAGLKLLALPEREALNRYKTAIALGNSASTKALFAALGVDFPFTEDDVIAAAQNLAARM